MKDFLDALKHYFDIFFGPSPKVGELWRLIGSRLADGFIVKVTKRTRFKVFYKFSENGEESIKGIYTFRRLYRLIDQ